MVRTIPAVFYRFLSTSAMSEKRQSQASSSRLQKLAACFPGAIVQFCRSSDGNTTVSKLEGKYEQLFGATATEIESQPEYFWHSIHPEDRSAFWGTLNASAENLQPWFWEGRLMGKDGSAIWVQGYATPEVVPQEGILWDGILLTSDRRSGESPAAAPESENLTTSEEERNFRAMFKQTFQLMGLLDSEGILLEANDTALEFIDRQREDVVGQPLWETPWFKISQEARQRVKEAIAQALQGNFIRYEQEILGANDRTITIDFSLKPVFNEAQEVVTLIPEARDITDLVETRQALQDSERILRAILDNTPVPIYLKDLQGRIILSNITHQRSLNCSESELLGKTDYELLSQATADEVRQNDRKVLEAGVSLEMEEKIPQGEQIRTYLSIKFPLCTEDGQPYAVGGISTDITDRKQAEEELAKYKQHLEELVEQRTRDLQTANEELQRTQWELERIFNFSLDILAVVNQEGYFEKISPAVTKILGYTPEEFLEIPFVDLLHPDDREAATQEFNRLMETQEPTFDFVNRLLGKDGKYRWLAWNATPATTEGMVYGVARDITAVKEAEEALQEEQERFRATFKQAPVGIAHVGVDGNFLRLNQKFCDIVGYTQTEMPSMRFQDLTHPEDWPNNSEYMRQLLAGEIDTFSLEKRHLHKEGFAVWVNATVSLVREASGDPKYFIAIIQDISDRKQAELALQESEAQLRQKADELQSTLEELQQTQTQLVQSEKMSGLGQLVAGIAHEINNPVNFIYGNLEHLTEYATDLLELVQQYQEEYTEPSEDLEELIEEKDVDFLAEDLPKMLDSMQIGAKRIRDIVKSLRTFSRMDEAEVKAVDLHEGIDSTLTILHNRLKFKSDRPGIHVVREYGEIPPVECYPGQLNQVFMNLFGNAIDALDEYSQEHPQQCKESRGEIHIATELREQERVVVRIRDNGPGIPEDVQQKIFDPFFTTKPVGKGTGMGLAISYQIITEKHQGNLQYSSHPGEGTEFVIEIPLHQKQAT